MIIVVRSIPTMHDLVKTLVWGGGKDNLRLRQEGLSPRGVEKARGSAPDPSTETLASVNRTGYTSSRRFELSHVLSKARRE